MTDKLPIQEIKALAERVDTDTKTKLFAYARLHSELAELTGLADPNEESKADILCIQDETKQRQAARVAKRMRGLSRIIGSRITD